jgi:hypothetical protein
MSKFVTLKTDKEHRRNKSYILGGIEVKFDQFCMVDVAERNVEKLIQAGLEVVDEEDIKKYASLKEKIETQAKEGVVADVDLYDENARLKVDNDTLKQKVDHYLKRIDELEKQLLELQKKEEVIEDEKVEESSEEKDDSLVDEINKIKTTKELEELCESLELPKEEWEGKKYQALKSYLKGKIK